MTPEKDASGSETPSGELRQITVLGRYGYGSIPTITQFVAEAARAAQLDEDSVFHCQMAVDEACTNVIEHAYEEVNPGNIELSCYVVVGRCTIRIIDHGNPFDPTAIPIPQPATDLESMRPGGVGLHLMRQLMDEVRFEFTDEGNTLTMVKTSSKSRQPDSSSDIVVWHDKRGISVIEPSGQVDSLVAGQLEESITNAIDQGHNWLLVDMGGVTYISSRGLKALVSGWRKTQDLNGQLALCSIVPRVLSIVDTIGFNQVFEIFPTREAALLTMTARKNASEKGVSL